MFERIVFSLLLFRCPHTNYSDICSPLLSLSCFKLLLDLMLEQGLVRGIDMVDAFYAIVKAGIVYHSYK